MPPVFLFGPDTLRATVAYRQLCTESPSAHAQTGPQNTTTLVQNNRPPSPPGRLSPPRRPRSTHDQATLLRALIDDPVRTAPKLPTLLRRRLRADYDSGADDCQQPRQPHNDQRTALLGKQPQLPGLKDFVEKLEVAKLEARFPISRLP